MHDTAHKHGRLFFELYGSDAFRTVVELGSQDVNGSLREHCPASIHYIGLDVMPAKGVDLVIDPGATLPLVSDSADAVVTSSAFEHDICFWDTFLELTRILRPGGLLYVNAPTNGDFHRHPLDCWRFYPDAGVALVQWAERRGVQIQLIESFIGLPQAEGWADFVAVFRKAGGAPLVSKGRIADHAPAINIHRPDLAADAPLGAETKSMPDNTIAENLRADLATARQNNTMLSTDLAKAEQSATMLSADLTTAAAELSSARQRIDALATDLATIQKAAAGLRQSLNTAEQRTNSLENTLAGVRRDLAAMENSTSWRMTAGLRWLMIRLRSH